MDVVSRLEPSTFTRPYQHRSIAAGRVNDRLTASSSSRLPADGQELLRSFRTNLVPGKARPSGEGRRERVRGGGDRAIGVAMGASDGLGNDGVDDAETQEILRGDL